MGRKPVVDNQQDVLDDTGPEDDSDIDDDADADPEAESDNIGDVSIEINVETLIAEIEAVEQQSPPGSARRKLEDYLEEKRTFRDIMDFEDYDLDD